VPFYFENDSTKRIARCRIEGRLTDEEIMECYRSACEIAALGDPQAGIFDLSGVKSFEVSSHTIHELVTLPRIIPNPNCVRMIIAEPIHIYGMSRIFLFLGRLTRPNLYVVRFEEEAWAILGVTKPQFKAYERKIV